MPFILMAIVMVTPSYALETSQAQDLRFNKAKVLIETGNEKKGMRLILENLKHGFHFDTELYLSQIYLKKEMYAHTYKILRHIVKNTLPQKIYKLKFDPSDPDSYLDDIEDTIEEASKGEASQNLNISQSQLSTLFYVADQFLTIYNQKAVSSEYLAFILAQAQKYFTICIEYKFKVIESHYKLSQIYHKRRQSYLAIKHGLKAFDLLVKSNNTSLKVTPSEIQAYLAQALIKENYAESGSLMMKSASLDPRVTTQLKEYIETFSKTLNQDFLEVSYDYLLKQKQNILQISDREKEDGATEKSSLVHHNHLNIYYQRQLNRKYNLTFGSDIQNEKVLDSESSDYSFTAFSFDSKLKSYSSKNSLSTYSFQYDKLSGRELPSLSMIQARSKIELAYEYFWLAQSGKWKIKLPFRSKSFQTHDATSLSASLEYESFDRSRYFTLRYLFEGGTQKEGDLYGNSTFYKFALTNLSHISSELELLTLAQYYSQSNSYDFLSFTSTQFDFILSYQAKKWKKTVITGGLSYQARSFANDAQYLMTDFSFGLKYNF